MSARRSTPRPKFRKNITVKLLPEFIVEQTLLKQKIDVITKVYFSSKEPIRTHQTSHIINECQLQQFILDFPVDPTL